MDQKIFDAIEKIGIIPVIVLNDVKNAKPLSEALVLGGLPAAEITFRTDAAEDAIREIAQSNPDILIGAGTVLTLGQAERAVSAGAKFIVSPGFDPNIVTWCLNEGICILPGICTPTELIQAYNMGLRNVTFFPSEQAGGIAMLKAMHAAFPDVRFMTTGGINQYNVEDYLKQDYILAACGSWMAGATLIDKGEFKAIQELTEEAASFVQKSRDK